MVSEMRLGRIAEQIREDLSEILLYEVADPRLAGLSVTDVRLDRELTFADIYVSSLEGSEVAKEALDGLKHASGYLRSELSKLIELRTFPRLRFHWDPTFEKAERIERLIASLHNTEPSGEHSDEAPEFLPGEEELDG
jgi:ribosome-binding factor A